MKDSSTKMALFVVAVMGLMAIALTACGLVT
jgi:hypothetical protein